MGRRVLIVDDEPGVRSLAADMLDAAGFEVLTATDAESALDILRAGTTVDLVLTDVLMPGQDGFDFAIDARAIKPGLPVLFLSGYTGARSLDGALGPMLQKPFTSAQLAEAVQRVLDGGTPGGRDTR